MAAIDGSEIRVLVRTHFDYISGARFLSAYIPQGTGSFASTEILIEVIHELVTKHEDFLITDVHTSMRFTFEDPWIHAHSLKFTGQFYIYIEAQHPAIILSTVTSQASRRGINLIVRGPNYAKARELAEQESNTSEKTPEVEPEITSDDLTGRPFDPNKVRTRVWTPTVDHLMRQIRDGIVDLEPDFQRNPGIWDDRAQSQLIESILVRVPLPAFYIDGADTNRMAVIDGVQRLTALKRFVIDGDLKLSGMEFLTNLGGKRFQDLSRSLQRRIEEAPLTIIVIEQGTPSDVKFILFKRINRGGMTLSAQELRHAMNPGLARNFLKGLAESDEFRQATGDALRTGRMVDRECALRFVAFTLTPPQAYFSSDLDIFLNQAMQRINQLDRNDLAYISFRFVRAMQWAFEIFGDKAFRKNADNRRRSIADNHRRSPINKALFEAWAINLDSHSDHELELLYTRRQKLIDNFYVLLDQSPDFEKAISTGTGIPSRVSLRFKAVETLIREVLK